VPSSYELKTVPEPNLILVAVNVVNAPVVGVVAPTVPLMLMLAVPVRFVTVPLDGVPRAPPLTKLPDAVPVNAPIKVVAEAVVAKVTLVSWSTVTAVTGVVVVLGVTFSSTFVPLAVAPHVSVVTPSQYAPALPSAEVVA